MKKTICLFAAIILMPFFLITLISCSTVEGTGRDRINFLSTKNEMKFGNDAYNQLKKENTFITNGPMYERVNLIGNKLVESARFLYPNNESIMGEWTFVVTDDDSLNAWALPGKHASINSGLIKRTNNDDEISMILAHEVAHVLARHGGERMSQQVLIGGAMLGASNALKKLDKNTKSIAIAALGAGAMVGVSLPYSRIHEYEADELGIMIAANAGYNPEAAISVWKMMSESTKDNKTPEWLSTHPASLNRMRKLMDLLPEAKKIYNSKRETYINPK